MNSLPIQKQAFSVAEFCQAHSIGKDRVYDAIRSGQLVARKYGKLTLIRAEDAAAFMAALPVLELPAGTSNPVASKGSKKQRLKAPATPGDGHVPT